MIGDPSPLQVSLRDGRPLTVALCRCGECNNEWYVPNHSDFTPQYCCYCGICFTHMTEGDLPPALKEPKEPDGNEPRV